MGPQPDKTGYRADRSFFDSESEMGSVIPFEFGPSPPRKKSLCKIKRVLFAPENPAPVRNRTSSSKFTALLSCETRSAPPSKQVTLCQTKGRFGAYRRDRLLGALWGTESAFTDGGKEHTQSRLP